MIRKLLYLTFPLLAFSACSGKLSEMAPAQEGLEDMCVTATCGGKTSLNPDLTVKWTAGDRISIMDDAGNHEFVTEKGGLTVTFKGKALKKGDHYALYPYDKDAAFDASDGDITTTVPSEQTGVQDSFGEGASLAAGKLDSENCFTAFNIGGIIRFSLIRNDVASVKFTAKGGEALSGKVKISFDSEGIPHTSPVQGSPSVTLVPVSGSFAPGSYYLGVLSCEMNSGYSVTITSTRGETHTIDSSELTTVGRSKYIDILHLDQALPWGTEELELLFYNTSTKKINQPFTENVPSSNTYTTRTFTLKNSTYKFEIGSPVSYFLGTYNNIYFGLVLTAGNSGKGWIKFPAISGKRLAYITLYSGTTMTKKKNFFIVESKDDISSPLATLTLGAMDSSSDGIVTAGLVDAQINKSYTLCVDPASAGNATFVKIVLTYQADGIGKDFPPYNVEVRKKYNSAWEMRQANTIDNIPGFELSGDPETDEYGGWICDLKFPSTGHFYVTKDSDGRWWLADPDGNPFISKGLCSFRVDLGSDTAKRAFEAKYKSSKQKWGEQETKWIRRRGFNSYGAFSSTNPRQYTDMPYIVHISPMEKYLTQAYGSSYPEGYVPVFDAAFATCADNVFKDAGFGTYKRDPRAMGIITDNEIPWENGMLAGCLAAPTTDDNYKAAVKWLNDNGYTTKDVSNVEVQQKFAAYALETYLKIVNNCIATYAPVLPYFGCKFDSQNNELSNPYAFEVAGKYMDAISIDYYGRWGVTQEQLQRWYNWSGKPVMFAEWYVKGNDSGLPNKSGVGWEVKTQKQRGYYYQMTCISLIQSKVSVGWQWFRYMDNDPDAGETGSNVDSNKGVVKVNFDQYTDFLDVMQQLHDNTYRLCRFYK